MAKTPNEASIRDVSGLDRGLRPPAYLAESRSAKAHGYALLTGRGVCVADAGQRLRELEERSSGLAPDDRATRRSTSVTT